MSTDQSESVTYPFMQRLVEVENWCSKHPIQYESEEQRRMHEEREKLLRKFSIWTGRHEVLYHMKIAVDELRLRYRNEQARS